jgi:hypothetical protein
MDRLANCQEQYSFGMHVPRNVFWPLSWRSIHGGSPLSARLFEISAQMADR